jgi:AraC-like DNA-binding protein
MSGNACLVPKIDQHLWRDPFTRDGLRLPALSGQEGFQIHEAGVRRLDEHWLFRGVCSPFWRLFYDFNAGAWVESGGERYALGPGRVVAMPDGVPFDCGSRRGVEHLWLHFSLHLVLPAAAPAVFALPAGSALRAVAGELRGFVAAGDAGVVRHAAAALLHLVFASRGVMPEPMQERLRTSCAWIERNLGGEITNAALAAQAGMSVEAFIRWFKARTGRTPAAFVAERRVREACRRLAFDEDSIEQVAEATGFANRHHFSRVFKQYAGCGPAEFRRGR